MRIRTRTEDSRLLLGFTPSSALACWVSGRDKRFNIVLIRKWSEGVLKGRWMYCQIL